jgi:hypothetical protein
MEAAMSNQPYVLHANAPERDTVRANLHAFIDRLPVAKSWSIIVGPYHKPRSDKQRSALFAVAYAPIMEHMGLRGEQDKADLHAFWCGEFWGWHPTLRNKPLRTTTRNERGERDVISTRVALDLYRFIQQRAAEQGIDVPDPDPFWKENAAKEST